MRRKNKRFYTPTIVRNWPAQSRRPFCPTTTTTPEVSMANPILSLRNVRKSYEAMDGNRLDVIQIGQFELGAGEQVALVGASGSGKSTLLNLIAGILLPDEGRITTNGQDVPQLGEAARDRFRAANIGYVFQSFNLLQGFTALENVLLGQMFGTSTGGTDRAVALLG